MRILLHEQGQLKQQMLLECYVLGSKERFVKLLYLENHIYHITLQSLNI